MKLVDIKRYRTILFDCDGVLLDSNQIKTEAFYRTAKTYGEQAAQSLVEYHKTNGGISRQVKFDYFLNEIIGKKLYKSIKQELLDKFAKEVKKGLEVCESVTNLEKLKVLCEQSRWAVISGGDQAEIRSILKKRGIANCFDMGIYGSPATKEEIVEKKVITNKENYPVLFIGDSQYDHKVAKKYGFDFLFVSEWSEWFNWKEYKEKYHFPSINKLEIWIEAMETKYKI